MDIQSHQRVNDILLAPLERPLLQWFAARMPLWVTPDRLTGIGLLGALLVGASYGATQWNSNFLWLANVGFFLNWFGDGLDGTLARYRRIERPKYGFFVDHTVDAIAQLAIVLGLGCSPYFTFSIACLGLIGYLLMSILVYVRTCVDGVFQISYGKIGPTEVRLLLVVLNIIIYFVGLVTIALPFATISVYDFLALTVAIALILTFIISSLRYARILAKIDP
ncbi:CDP-alcohol phosphatidyltransferase family protein [Oxynema sp. CENA135]|uniref:CDP-alcohol phosphatidyltransferase family protein n=1 Tax=Oxynema sp. CENA135 TaxID=984206 RepID=UPI00190926ED|nr:CDP-alcohol phosphatidyltransferase family protein [Oxynema sp. CENA135]MBK4730467.1 CDP-alcohol phosphatidyltransferase family protein [Oxynema sp. CENA135]